MAIEKLTSIDINNIINDSDLNFDKINQDIEDLYDNITKKDKILYNYHQYNNHMLAKINTVISNINSENNKFTGFENKKMLTEENEVRGNYERFGDYIYKKFRTVPIDVLNVPSKEGTIYRDIAEMYINDTLITDDTMDVLKSREIMDKKYVMNEYNIDYLLLTVQFDSKATLGRNDVNVIEIDPFLAGSFDIRSVRITDRDGNYEEKKNIKNVGPMRIVLDNKYNVSTVVFDIRLKYKNENDLYPFGLKSLRFLNANFIDDSYFITAIDKKRYIERVYDAVYFGTPYGILMESIKDSNSELFVDNGTDVLEYRIESTSKNFDYPININTRTFFIKSKIPHHGISYIEFDNIETRV